MSNVFMPNAKNTMAFFLPAGQLTNLINENPLGKKALQDGPLNDDQIEDIIADYGACYVPDFFEFQSGSHKEYDKKSKRSKIKTYGNFKMMISSKPSYVPNTPFDVMFLSYDTFGNMMIKGYREIKIENVSSVLDNIDDKYYDTMYFSSEKPIENWKVICTQTEE